MVREQLEIIIDGDASGAKNASKQANAAMGGLGNTLKKMAIAGGALFLAKKAFDALGAAMRKVMDFIKKSIELAGEQELQEKKLAQAMISTGYYTEKTYEELKEYAKSLQDVTRYGDETIIGVEAMLQTFKLEKDELKLATLATLDLAAATGQDLQSAAILMGKAAVGEIGTLSRYGIIIDKAKFAAEGFSVVLDEINTEFGGQAQAQAETFTGRLDQMKNTFGDMQEELGNAFIPTISKVVEWFVKGKDIVDPLTGSVEHLASPWEKLQGWIKEATTSMSGWLELNWSNIIGIAESTFEKIENFITIVKEADYTPLKEGLDDLAIAFDTVRGDEDSGAEGASTSIQKIITGIGTIMSITAGLSTTFKIAFDIISLAIGGTLVSLFLFGEALAAIDIWFKDHDLGRQAFIELGKGIDALQTTIFDTSGNIKGNWQDLLAIIGYTNVTTMDGVEGKVVSTMAALATAYKNGEIPPEEYNKRVLELTGESTDGASDLVYAMIVEWRRQYAAGEISYEELMLNMSKVSKDKFGEIQKSGVSSYDEIGGAVVLAQTEIDKMHGVNISSTHTITTLYETIGAPIAHAQGYARRQTGGLISGNQFASDLNIPLIKGEAVLPAPIVRAIKENRGSFAGINMNTNNNSKINLIVNITGNTFVDKEDLLDNIEKEIPRRLNLQGANLG